MSDSIDATLHIQHFLSATFSSPHTGCSVLSGLLFMESFASFLTFSLFLKKIKINYCQASIVYYARHTALCPEEPEFCEEMKDTILSIFVLFGGITFPHQQRKSCFTSGSFIFLFPTDVCLQLVSHSKHVSNYHGCFSSSYLGQLSCLCHNTGLPPFFKTSDCFDASALVHPLNQFFCGFNPDKRQAYRPVRLLSVC